MGTQKQNQVWEEHDELGFGHLVSINALEDTNGLIEAEISETMT